jgi:hypothetical protein
MSYLKEINELYHPKNLKKYCIGNVEECEALTARGATRLRWGDLPDNEQINLIESLALLPIEKQVKSIRKYQMVKQLSKLTHLVTPIELFEEAKENFLPSTLTSLLLGKTGAYQKGQQYDMQSWMFTSIHALTILDENELIETFHPILSRFPNLGYLETVIDKQGNVLNTILEMTQLEYLRLRHCKSHILSGLTRIPLKALSLNNMSKEITFIQDMTSLKAVHLNTIRSEIDCSLFLKLPELVEIDILHSKKIENIEALLECKQLKSVHFLQCGKPFTSEQKNRFKAHGFQHLEIDFA